MITRFHVSTKLEKTLPFKLEKAPKEPTEHPLGTWNIRLIYLNRKKCWFITNSKTYFTFFIPCVTNKVLKDIDKIIADWFFRQASYSINLYSPFSITELLGEIKLYRTNGDRKTLGVQNNMLLNFEHFKAGKKSINDWDFLERSDSINWFLWGSPKYLTPYKEMKKLLDEHLPIDNSGIHFPMPCVKIRDKFD